ncbi:hypothetical protein ABZX51_000391 [Aspergillus tubingensis]
MDSLVSPWVQAKMTGTPRLPFLLLCRFMIANPSAEQCCRWISSGPLLLLSMQITANTGRSFQSELQNLKREKPDRRPIHHAHQRLSGELGTIGWLWEAS